MEMPKLQYLVERVQTGRPYGWRQKKKFPKILPAKGQTETDATGIPLGPQSPDSNTNQGGPTPS